MRYLRARMPAPDPTRPRLVRFITHPEVAIDPAVPVPDWPLSERGTERMTAMLSQPWVADVAAIWSSTERKARDGAEILARHLGLQPRVREALGENDRSATGYLPPDEFQAVADEFFARPTESVRGWERAVDAQARIVAAADDVLASRADSAAGDVAIIAHGGVGALLLAHLLGAPISREHDQPGGGGGQCFAFEQASRALVHGWRAIDEFVD